MIGTTGEGWLYTLSSRPDSAWGDVEQFHEDMQECARQRRSEHDPIIVETNVWGKLKTTSVLPAPGDGFALYHSTRAGFPKGDKFGKKPRISAMGELLDYKHEGREVTWIKVAIEPDVLEFLESNPIIRDRGSSTGSLFEHCIPPGFPASFYKVDSPTWNEFVSLLPNQAPRYVPPSDVPLPPGDAQPRRRKSSVERIVRETVVTEKVKQLHNYRCQVCGLRLETPDGPYAEGAHIRPLGSPHDGPDIPANVLCLCPNHHVLFDHGAFTIRDDLKFIGKNGKLRTVRGHQLATVHLKYHREIISERVPKKL